MILGKITGKVTTNEFEFDAVLPIKKFDYVQIYHKEYDYVLCQIIEIEKTDRTLAKCIVIGTKDPQGRIRPIRTPFEPDTEVLSAENDFIRQIINIENLKEGAYIGKLEGRDINVFLNLNTLLTKHIAILAKSGAGKSYTVGVLLEELIERKIPVIVIDPHGEYSSLKFKNDDKDDIALMEKFNIKPASFSKAIKEYGDMNINPDFSPLILNHELKPHELIHLFPGKLSSNQQALLFSSIKELKTITFDNLCLALDASPNNNKYNILNILQYLKGTGLFSSAYTPYNELVQLNRCSIINLKGIPPELQEIIVYKLFSDLFDYRKLNKVPPFFAIIEEAHNYVPERGFGDSKSASIIRTIASEGRKFGLGIAVISQRPAIVQKTVLSQCTTQIILKVTNPNDLKALTSSVEGLTSESEKEIKNLPIGTALITGVTDMPLFVTIRPRKTKHGGKAIRILEEDKNFIEEVKEFKEILPLIKPNTSAEDLRIMSEKDAKIKTILVPGCIFRCKDKKAEYFLLIELVNGELVVDVDGLKTALLPNIDELDGNEIKILEVIFKLKHASSPDLISKGFGLDYEKIIDSLIRKGYVLFDGKYKINDKYALSALSKYSMPKNVEYLQISYDEKLKKGVNIDQVKEKLNKLTNVIDANDCFIVQYLV